MSKILPFGQRNPRAPVPTDVKHYLLRDDALSVDGEHPLRGDLCSVQLNQEMNGELHLVRTDAGEVLCGFLTREGSGIYLTFPNSKYPSYKGDDARAQIIGRVVDFFFKADDATRASITLSAKMFAARLANTVLPDAATVPQDAIVNWRADAQGCIMFASENGGSHFPSGDRTLTWDYIELVHPEQRERVRRLWMKALATRTHFNVVCEALTTHGYQLMRNMAVPVHNQETGCDEWVGTLILMRQEVATGTSEVGGR